GTSDTGGEQMSRGPLPNPTRRRRNAPTIPSTELPPEGRQGDPPELPEGYDLLGPGLAWWGWAWSTPQATQWDDGALYAVARRAKLEDDLWLLERADEFDLAGLLQMEDEGKLLKQV